jgi:hypothetical protein
MLTNFQKATLKTLGGNDPELITFLTHVSKYIMAPKILNHCLLNGITGEQLKRLAIKDFQGDPQKFIQGMQRKINGKVL